MRVAFSYHAEKLIPTNIFYQRIFWPKPSIHYKTQQKRESLSGVQECTELILRLYWSVWVHWHVWRYYASGTGLEMCGHESFTVMNLKGNLLKPLNHTNLISSLIWTYSEIIICRNAAGSKQPSLQSVITIWYCRIKQIPESKICL